MCCLAGLPRRPKGNDVCNQYESPTKDQRDGNNFVRISNSIFEGTQKSRQEKRPKRCKDRLAAVDDGGLNRSDLGLESVHPKEGQNGANHGEKENDDEEDRRKEQF